MVDLHAAFGEQLLDVTVREVVAQVPADRHHDHIWREPEPGERRPRWQQRAETSQQHHPSVPDGHYQRAYGSCQPATQRCLTRLVCPLWSSLLIDADA